LTDIKYFGIIQDSPSLWC